MVSYYRSIRTQQSLPEICDAIRAKFPRIECAIEATKATATLDDATAKLQLAELNATRERSCNLTLELRFQDYEHQTKWNELLDALHEPPKIRYASSYFFASDLPLATCCERIAEAFGLPDFELDDENDNAWGFSEDDAAIVHVSRAHRAETYHQWHPKKCPPGCNYHVEVDVKAAAPSELDDAWLKDVWRPRWVALFVEIAGRVFDGERWSDGASTIRTSR